MAQSDITIDALDKVGKEDAEYLVSLVRSASFSVISCRCSPTPKG